MHISSLHLYPIKACGGIDLQEWEIDSFGLRHDRRWMVVTPRGQGLTQRDHPRFALLRPRITEEELAIAGPGMPEIRLPLTPSGGASLTVQVWDDVCTGWSGEPAVDRWFSDYLGAEVRLVWMPPVTVRAVNRSYSPELHRTSFTDGFPILAIGQGSLDDLNRRLPAPLPMNRFRPNLVVAGSAPFAEDDWERIRVGELELDVVKPCVRCVVTTTDQETGERGKEPLQTLATYRRTGSEVRFGQNVIHRRQGRIRVGELVEVLQTRVNRER